MARVSAGSAGTLTISNDNTVLNGDLQVKGGDLTTNQTTFNLLKFIMKKIFLSLLFFCALCNTALAQDKVQEKKAKDPVYLAKAEIAELVKEITLESSLENGLISLLTYKHETLAKVTTDNERNQIYEIMRSKLEGSLSPEQLKGISQTSCKVLSDLGSQIQWVNSYVTTDKIYCIYNN